MEERPASDAGRTEIVVRGRFGPALSSALMAYFAEMTVDDGHTRLVADVPDQTALLGLLDVLDAVSVHIVSVNRFDGDGRLARPSGADTAGADWSPQY